MQVSELSDRIGVDGKEIRKWLRQNYGHCDGRRWYLDDRQVAMVTKYFESHPKGPSSGRSSPRIPPALVGIPRYILRHTSPSLLMLKIEQLKEHPQSTVVFPVGGTEIKFLRIVDHWQKSPRNSSDVTVLLSDGQIKTQEELKVSGYRLENAYSLCQLLNSDGTGPSWRVHHNNFVERLTLVQVPQSYVLILLSDCTGPEDTPQEIMMDWFSLKIGMRLTADTVFNYSLETGKDILDLTLNSILSLKVKEETTPYSRNRHQDYGPVVNALSKYLATVNLFNGDPHTNGVLDITLRDVYRRFHFDIGVRAENLRKEVAEKYGFVQERDGWVCSRNKPGSWVKDVVRIGPDLKVHINNQFVCIVSAKRSSLPYEDEVARRMLCVATAHRDQVYTIRGEMKLALERLFSLGGEDEPERRTTGTRQE